MPTFPKSPRFPSQGTSSGIPKPNYQKPARTHPHFERSASVEPLAITDLAGLDVSNCSSILPKSSAGHTPYVPKTAKLHENFDVSTKLHCWTRANIQKKVEVLQELILVLRERVRLQDEMSENHKREARLARELARK